MVFSCFFIHKGGDIPHMWRTEGERPEFCNQRWEPVFRGERRKVILDRAKHPASYSYSERGIHYEEN